MLLRTLYSSQLSTFTDPVYGLCIKAPSPPGREREIVALLNQWHVLLVLELISHALSGTDAVTFYCRRLSTIHGMTLIHIPPLWTTMGTCLLR